MKFESRIFNNIEYTLVDVYDWKTGEKIYHFASDEENLFCFKKDENYIVIEEKELVQEIKNEYDLNTIEIWIRGKLPPKLSIFNGVIVTKILRGREKREFKQEQLEKLMKLNHNIKYENLVKRLAGVNICVANWPRKEALAFYNTHTDSMYFKEDDINKNNINARRTRLHETIHAISGASSLLHAYSLIPGLVEGATENMVEKVYGNGTSSYENNIHFNLSKESSYKYLVSIVKQMEVALGKPCDRSILLGKNNFFNEFKEIYGIHAFRILRHRTNKLRLAHKLIDSKQYFLDTQKMLMETIFDRDFAYVTDINQAKAYFEKLLEYGNVRGNFAEDSSYQEYYQTKLADMKMFMSQMGYDASELDIYEQKSPECYPVFKAEDVMNNLYRWVAENIAKEIKTPEKIHRELLKYRIGMGQSEENNYYFLAKNNRIYKVATENRQTGARKEIFFPPEEEVQQEGPLQITIADSQVYGYFITIDEVNPQYLRSKKFENHLSDRISNRLEMEQKKSDKQKAELNKLAIQQHFDTVMDMLEEIKQLFNRNRSGEIEQKNLKQTGEHYGDR